MVRRLSILALVWLVASPAAAQEITNRPVFHDPEGPSPLARRYVRASGAAQVRWEQRAEHAIAEDLGRPEAWTEVVVARWDAELCAKKRGPFCRERGGWVLHQTLNARDTEVQQVDATGATGGHYLIFGRSRYDPSPRKSWGLDMLIADDPVDEPAGARRFTFDTSATVGGGVRYSVIVVPAN